jgi:hypothetical protein
MKSQIAAVLAVTAAAVLNAGNPQDGLTVHEWGTFTSVAGEDGRAINWEVLGGKDDLPGFVNGRWDFRCAKWRLTGTVRMETPVLYFYSPKSLDAQVKVAFPSGLMTEWYPQADFQVHQRNGTDGALFRLENNLNGIDSSLRTVVGGLEWKDIKVEPNTTPALPAEAKPSRYYEARATDASPLAVGIQHEKFLFYRGIGRFDVPLSARLMLEGKLAINKLGTDPVPMAIWFENRGGHIGYRIGGTVSNSVSIDAPRLDGSLPELLNQLEDTLFAQGLFRKEAHAMVETWKDSWFEEGSRIIYIVPRAAVDRILPLQVNPAPSRTIRAFVGRIELITPEIKQTVQTAMAANDQPTLNRYGRFLEPILRRIAAENLSLSSKANQLIATLQVSSCR